ncbi:MAG: TolB-like 6-bladed beta-propeller domain-containing protein [Bacteroides sp.]|jgi:hypothetical protein|nr:TolB-like 6-bladed beta-propeller domain-containing protein [Bacteroides sp.]
MHIICLSVFCSFFLACTFHSDDIKERYVTFPKEQQLEAQSITLDTALFRYPFRVKVSGNKVAVMDLHGTDYFIRLFHYPDFRYMTSCGRHGDSPVEMLSAENIRWINNSLWTLDANNSILTRFGFALSGDSLLRDETVRLDKELLRCLDFVQYDDSTFIIPDYSGESRFCWVNRFGCLLRKTGLIPSSNEDALKHARPALAQAWRSFIDYNPHNGVLAAVTQLGEVLEIYNLKDSTHVVCMGPGGEPEFSVSEGYGIPAGIMGFSDVQVTDSAIYAIFHGHSFKDIRREMQKGHVQDGGRYIYVFSLQGKPLRKYTLDRYVYGIYVDERRGVIMATDVNSDEPIVEFKLI